MKFLDLNKEEIRVSYVKKEKRYTDEGYTLYLLSKKRKECRLDTLSPELYGALDKIAKKYGVTLINNELMIDKDSSENNIKHYEMANLLNCILAINSLIRFTDIFAHN
ncbi:DUF1828 domain-containing protein [Lactobacillus crispatus]